MFHSQLSIVVQGPIYAEGQGKNTYDVLASYRRLFPNAEIILSTWKSLIDTKKLQELNVILVTSDDPGSDNSGDATFNLNRQIISSHAGLNRATQKYCIKTRTDAFIHNDIFMHYYKLHIDHQPNGFIFKQPVLVYSSSSRNWSKGFIPHLFHPCDWFFFGLTTDVAEIFSIPVIDEEDLTYFKNRKSTRTPSFSGWCRYTPEQWIFVQLLIKKGVLGKESFPFYGYRDKKMLALNKRIHREDLIVLDADQLALHSWKYPKPHSRNIQISQLRHEEWVSACQIAHMPFARTPWHYRLRRLVGYRVTSLLGRIKYYRKQCFRKIKS